VIILGHDIHVFVDRTLFGKAYWKIHREMDWPYGFLGRRHRVLFHDPLTASAIARSCYPGDENAVLAALVHIEIDDLCSANPFLSVSLSFSWMLRRRRGREPRRASQRSSSFFHLNGSST
jgi:hypothetical protein